MLTKEAKLEIDEEKYVESFKPHMMDVVSDWCSGATFNQILTKTEIYEGMLPFFFLESNGNLDFLC